MAIGKFITLDYLVAREFSSLSAVKVVHNEYRKLNCA